MKPWSPGYQPAPRDDSSDSDVLLEKAPISYRTSTRKRDLAFLLIPSLISVGTVVALLVLATTVAHSTARQSPVIMHNFRPDHEYHGYHGSHDVEVVTTPGVKHCGKTAAEARKLGCVFDTISFSWLVPECYDQQLVEEFDKLPVKFPFFYDPNGKSEAPWEEVVKGERAMYVPWSHHLWHCGFLWRKMHRALMAGVPIDSYIGNYTHTEHCTQIMVEENRQHAMEDVNTIMALKFPVCTMGEQQWVGGTNFTGF